jgi:tetratricopeptide (TPR) repeat protein
MSFIYSMSQTIQIILNVFWLLLILGFIGWMLVRSLKRSEDPPKLIFKWIVTAVVLWFEFVVAVPDFIKGGIDGLFGLVTALLCGLTMVLVWRGSITDMIAKPFASLYDGGDEPPEPKPYYSIALSKRKSSKPLEAIIAIREQLAKFPNDYEGVMLLANIQAEDMKDLQSTEITLRHFFDSPGAPPKQVAAALMQLADWHLKLAQDSDSARAALEKIIEKFPETELTLIAKQRIAHLGGTEKILLAAHDRQAMAVPEGIKNIGLLDSSKHLIPKETDPAEVARIYVKHLEKNPHDTEIREKLAIIYAEHYGRLDLATDELQQLIEHPDQPHKRVAHWLNLLADLQIRHGADHDTVRQTLERIVEKFPDLPVADIARSRLNRLKLEMKGKTETPNKKLGVYEQNIGLKGDRIYSPRQL